MDKHIKHRKLLCLLLAIALMIIAVACTPQSPDPGNASATPGGTSQATAAPAAQTPAASESGGIAISGPNEFPIVTEPLTLKVWALQRVQLDDPLTNTMTIEYERKTGVTLDWTVVSGEAANAQLSLNVASGEHPDMYLRSFTAEQVQMMAEANALRPLGDLIEEHGVNLKQVFAEHPEFKDLITANDGNIYTLFETDIGVHMINQQKMFAFRPWLEALGGKAPQTTAEFKDYLIAIRDGDLNNNGRNDEIPFISDNTGTGDPVFFIMNSFEPTTRNFYKISDDGEIIFAADKDGWREGLRYMNELYEEQLFYAEETYTQGGDALKALVNIDPEGDFLVGAISHFWQGNYVDISVLNWTDFAPIPPLEGPDGTREVPASGPVFRLVSAITTNCQYPEVAIKWLDFWAGDEGAFANNYGFIEGHGYEWTDEPSYAGEPRSIRTIAQENIRWGASMVPKNDKFAEIRYVVTDVVEDRHKVANIHVLNEAAAEYEPYYVPHNVPQISWSTAEVLTAMTEQRTLINDYVKQAYTEFILGIRDLDKDWDRYLADLSSMGLENYLELLKTHHGLD